MRNIKQWFIKNKFWLKSGINGSIVCFSFFLFYIFIYFPVIDKIYANDILDYGGTPNWTMNIPLITGHFFIIFSSFILEMIGLGGKGLEFISALLFAVSLMLIYFLIGSLVGFIIHKIKKN